MTEPPPRKRFQIHLSTAIVMMFVAGALIWANVHTYQVKSDFWLEEKADGAQQWLIFEMRGWPLHYSIKDFGTKNEIALEAVRLAKYTVNLCVAMLLLLGLATFCEWLIRRSVSRKEL